MTFELLATSRCRGLSAMRNCTDHASVAASDIVSDSTELLGRLRDRVAHTDTVIIPVGIQPTLFLARNAAALPPQNVFPLSPAADLEELNDKWRFFQLAQQLSLPTPATVLISSADNVPELPAGKLVLKPVHGEGSLGLRFADSPAEVESVIGRIDAAGLLPVLVQEYVPGFDLTLSVIARNGSVLGGRVQQVAADRSLEFVNLPSAIGMAEEIVSAKSVHGVLSFDMRGTPSEGGLYLTECNPRLWASCHKAAYTGMNVVDIGVGMARREPVMIEPVVPTSVLSPTSTVTRLLRGNFASVSPASRRFAHAELDNWRSALTSIVEKRLGGPSAVERGELLERWVSFDDEDGLRPAW
jgi:predicted ATP-grasp superfamily ATP-dependent carboligase